MEDKITPAERKRLAESLGMSDAYLYQCLTGHRDMGPGRAREVETATNGRLHRKALCQKTWAAIWPELSDQSSLRT